MSAITVGYEIKRVLVGMTFTLSFSSVQSWGKAPVDQSHLLRCPPRGLQLSISGLLLQLSLSSGRLLLEAVIGYCSSDRVSYILSQSVSEGGSPSVKLHFHSSEISRMLRSSGTYSFVHPQDAKLT